MKDECSMLKLQLKERDELICQLQEELVSDKKYLAHKYIFLAKLFAINPPTTFFGNNNIMYKLLVLQSDKLSIL